MAIRIVMLAALLLIPLYALDAHAQHHGGDIPPAIVGDRKVAPKLNIEQGTNEYTGHLKLVDDNTGNMIPHVTFFVSISKDGTSVFKEWFHDHEGDLPFTIRPKDTEKVKVFCDREPNLNGCMKTGGNPVIIEGPLLMTAGTYLFKIEVFSIDNDKTILKEPLKFEMEMPIGYSEEHKGHENANVNEAPNAAQSAITVAMKLTKKSTLLAVKNVGEEDVYSVKIKSSDGAIRFVKAKGWEREKVDANTIMIKGDKPITMGKSLFVILIVEKQGSGIEWTAFDSDTNMLGAGAMIPRMN